MNLGQGIESDRAVDAPKAVECVSARIGETLGHRVDGHAQVQAVLLAGPRDVGYLPFHRGEQVLAVSQQLAVEPVVRPRVNRIEPQEDPIARPLFRNHELMGNGHRFVLGHIVALLKPLAGHFEIAPLGGVQRLGTGIFRRVGIDPPDAV